MAEVWVWRVVVERWNRVWSVAVEKGGGDDEVWQIVQGHGGEGWQLTIWFDLGLISKGVGVLVYLSWAREVGWEKGLFVYLD